ncbi:unnamed protein product [Rhizophagus irregularis]|nr:unnamed protein product [Rhizophagus irregularis]
MLLDYSDDVWTLSLAMLADRFGSGPKLGVVMGTVLSANTLGAIIGPLIGGLLYQYWGYVAPFFFCAILAFFGFLPIIVVASILAGLEPILPIYLRKEFDGRCIPDWINIYCNSNTNIFIASSGIYFVLYRTKKKHAV